MTRYAIGDIHGGSKTFWALLDKIGLCREDRVYLLGDYIDRGPDSRGVLDIIMQLQADGYDIRPIRGNHEEMLIRNIIDVHDEWARYYKDGWGAEMLKSFGISAPGELPVRYKEFLFSLPYCLEDDYFILVHASLDMSKDDPVTQTPSEHMIWGSGGLISDNDIPGRVIISGHKIRSVSKIMGSLEFPHIQIDNGAFSNEPPELGNLVALNLDEMQLTFQPWIDAETKLTVYIHDKCSTSAQETELPVKQISIHHKIIIDDSVLGDVAFADLYRFGDLEAVTRPLIHYIGGSITKKVYLSRLHGEPTPVVDEFKFSWGRAGQPDVDLIVSSSPPSGENRENGILRDF